MRRFLLFVLLLSGCGFSARAAEVVAFDRLRLESGEEIVLAGIGAPLDLAEQDKARDALAALVAEGEPRVQEVGQDRRGRKLGLLYLKKKKNEILAQTEMLRAGVVFAFPREEVSAEWTAFLAAEREARRAQRGLWQEKMTDVTVEQAALRVGVYSFVVGTVQDVAERKKVTYLNFGEDWRDDFTVTLTDAARRQLKKRKTAPETLAGKKLRVRGVVDDHNGPMITLVRAEAIEILE